MLHEPYFVESGLYAGGVHFHGEDAVGLGHIVETRHDESRIAVGDRVETGLTAISQLPVFIVWADADIAFDDRERRRWEAELADHTTVILPGVGYFLQSDAPAEFAAAIYRLVGRIRQRHNDTRTGSEIAATYYPAGFVVRSPMIQTCDVGSRGCPR
ncbi:alpha/beta fold hydrolase [Nocardia sp. IFM 10818]